MISRQIGLVHEKTMASDIPNTFIIKFQAEINMYKYKPKSFRPGIIDIAMDVE